MSIVRLLIIQFNNTIERKEIPLFRGAVIESVKDSNNVLFHNHIGEGFRYSYPLIQYKRIHQKAAIVCINEGTDSIGEFFSSCNFQFKLGEKYVEMIIDSVKAYQVQVQCWDTSFSYYLRNWLPLNSDNYEQYKKLDGLVEQTTFLEKILIGNILSFLKGINIHLEDEIKCKIIALNEPKIARSKGVKLMSFDIEFKTNIHLPDYIGLGKNTSLGYGIIKRIKKDLL